MKMHLLSGGRLLMRRSIYYPNAPTEATLELPVICVLLKHKQGNVLFDTGCHPSAADDAAGRWGEWSQEIEAIFDARQAVIGQLPAAGLMPDDIDVVICSHLHFDHCGCNEFFKKATVICHAKELEIAKSAKAVRYGYIRADWDHDMPFEPIHGDRDLFGDGRLTLIPLPGHTAGMVIAHAVLEREGAFVLASDAAPVRACLEQRYAPGNNWDADLSVRGLDEIARLEKNGAHVLFGHDDAQWQSVRKGAEAYE